MPNWSDILSEMRQVPSAMDSVRRKYLQELSAQTHRATIAYYSGWLQKPGQWLSSVSDDDKNGFMNAVHKMDRTKGLDLILHTPGGDLAATESIIEYLRVMFSNNIRAIIPQMAMSAGTMMACACREIIMGKQSSIGPIDPQFNGIPAHGVLEEFKRAITEVKKDPGSLPIWRIVIEKYHPTFIGECQHAIELSSQMVTKWLVTGMFEGDAKAHEKAHHIVTALNNHNDTKTHARHIDVTQAASFGLKIASLEDDPALQDAVLSVHHTYMHTLANTQVIKIIENDMGSACCFAVGSK
jgi:membrane-bound ClpP family serine protease